VRHRRRVVGHRVVPGAPRPGHPYDCFEAGSQIGGNWRYLNDNQMSSAYRSLHINTSRKVMEYAAFPMPEELPDYPHHAQIAAYFDSYVDHFGLRDTITFRTEVTRVEPADAGWSVTTRNRDTGEHRTAHYGAVLVANGHHWDPRYPEPPFPGTFDGEQTHAHHYKVPDPYAGRRVLVVGIGNSATDIAVETSHVSERTFLAMRRGAHVIPKYIFGQPFDRLAKTPLARAPLWFQRLTLRILLRLAQGRMTDYGLPAPDHKVLSAHPTISSDLLTRLGHGDITVKPNVERLDGDTVRFVDGSSERIDAIIYCTGYKISFRSSTSSRPPTTRSTCSTGSSRRSIRGSTSSVWCSRSARSCRWPRRSRMGRRPAGGQGRAATGRRRAAGDLAVPPAQRAPVSRLEAAHHRGRLPGPPQGDRAGTPAGARRRAAASVARHDQTGLVGHHDGLRAVAQAELGQHPADVGLDGLLPHHEPGRDLRVRQTLGDQPQHLGLAGRQRLDPRVRIAPAPAHRANSATRRRVTVGASSASPAATTRTASKSRSAVASLSRNPLAPASSAS
jgi:cation diffusion facilitator CzcD-associated flavoprotein CzcO